MKNKKILYILTFIITFFTFNLNVDAAQELVCVYTKGTVNSKAMLEQDASGNQTVYVNDADESRVGKGWVKTDGKVIYDSSVANNLVASDGSLTACPASSELDGECWICGSLRLYLYTTDTTSRQGLQNQYTDFKIPLGGGGGNVQTNLLGSQQTELTCATLFSGKEGEDLLGLIKTAFTLVKIAIPILLIGFGTLDFAKAIFAGKEDEMKKAQDKFMKRIAIGIGVFLVPTLLKLILTVANGIWSNISPDFCGII